jgi:hypothetical protein
MTQMMNLKVTSIPRGKTADDLVRYLAAMVIADDLHQWDAHKRFPALAKALGVDLSPFLAVNKKAPAQPPAKKSASKRKRS